MSTLAFVMGAVGIALAAFAAFHAWRSLQVSIALLAGVIAYEVALVVQLAVFAAALSERAVDPLVLIGYLVACLVLPVAALLWGLSDTSTWGAGVVAVGMLGVGVMCLRVGQIWLQAA